jgi:hypothetical protein
VEDLQWQVTPVTTLEEEEEVLDYLDKELMVPLPQQEQELVEEEAVAEGMVHRPPMDLILL